MPGCLLLGRGSSQLEATKDSLDTKLEDVCARIARDVVEKHGDCVARHVGDTIMFAWRFVSTNLGAVLKVELRVEELDSQATQALSEVAKDQDASTARTMPTGWKPVGPHQLSWTRWAQSLPVLPRVVLLSCVSSRSNALGIVEAQLRAELDRHVNENDLRHMEPTAVFPQYLEAPGTKLSVEIVGMQSDQDAKLEKQYHTLLGAQDTSYLLTRLLVRPVRRVDLHASSCFLAES